jgi:acetolactate synthase-1/2/3 large subunit
VQVTRASELLEAVAKAFYLARAGRPGPVVIDITKDAQLDEVDFVYRRSTGIRSYVPVTLPPADRYDDAARLIDEAQRPYVIVGQGATLSGAEPELLRFAERLGAPVATTLLGLSAFPTDHPLSVGMVGMHGRYGANIKTNECDVLIAVGMRFDDRVTGDLNTYARQAKVIHLEIDAAEIDKNVKTTVALHGDARRSLVELTARIGAHRHEAWLEEFRVCDRIEHEKVIAREVYPTEGGLRMGEVVRAVAEQTRGEAVIVSDVGQHQMMAARYSQFRCPTSNVTSGGLGTMGFCLPAALGAQLGVPRRTVVAFVGDGGLQMTLQELGTISQTEAPVKVVLLNNSFLGMVRQWQELFFERRYSETEMTNPDFCKISDAYGIPAERVTEREALGPAVRRMLAHPGPFFLEVVVEKEGNVWPMVPSMSSVSNIKLGA